MSTAEIEQSALQLPIEERLQLARRLVESIGAVYIQQVMTKEGIRRLEDIDSGKFQELTHEELLESLK